MKAKATVRSVLREALCDAELWGKIEPYISNGGVCGHKVLDWGDAVSIILTSEYGPRVAQFNLKKKVIMDNLKNVVRERYELDKDWKVVRRLYGEGFSFTPQR